MVQNFASNLFAMTNDAEDDMGNIEWALKTLKSSFSGPTAPSAERGQLWYDTTRSLLRHRGATNQWRGVIAFKDDGNYLNITKIWVYANAVEEGFTEDTDCADCVISVKGDSYAYNVTGGDGNPRGQWEITGIADHTDHRHKVYEGEVGLFTELVISTQVASFGRAFTWNDSGTKILFAGELDTSDNVVALSHASSNGQWRPQAAVGIMIYPSII